MFADEGSAANKAAARYVVLDWQPEAFSSGAVEKQRLEADSTSFSGVACGRGGANKINLHTCLDLFSSQEQLDEENAWYCPKCKEFRQGTKQMQARRRPRPIPPPPHLPATTTFPPPPAPPPAAAPSPPPSPRSACLSGFPRLPPRQFWSAPPCLVVHLKRFSAQGMWRRKLDTAVDFPLEGLDLAPYIKAPPEPGAPPPVYDLVAVSNHFGSTGGGHYTAYAKHSDDGRWYCYDDSHVTPVNDPADVVTAAAYVLFYVQRGSFVPASAQTGHESRNNGFSSQ